MAGYELAQLANHAERDPDSVLIKNPTRVRWYEIGNGHDFDQLLTGPKILFRADLVAVRSARLRTFFGINLFIEPPRATLVHICATEPKGLKNGRFRARSPKPAL